MCRSDAKLVRETQKALESLGEEGLAGVAEHPELPSLIKQLHGNAAAAQQHDALLKALHAGAEEHITGAEDPTFAALGVMSQLLKGALPMEHIGMAHGPCDMDPHG